MTVTETLVDIVTTPWVAATSVVTTLGQLTGLWPVFDFIATQASLWFGPLAIFSGSIAPNLSWVPQEAVMGVFVGLAAIVFIRRVNTAVDSMRDRYS